MRRLMHIWRAEPGEASQLLCQRLAESLAGALASAGELVALPSPDESPPQSDFTAYLAARRRCAANIAGQEALLLVQLARTRQLAHDARRTSPMLDAECAVFSLATHWVSDALAADDMPGAPPLHGHELVAFLLARRPTKGDRSAHIICGRMAVEPLIASCLALQSAIARLAELWVLTPAKSPGAGTSIAPSDSTNPGMTRQDGAPDLPLETQHETPHTPIADASQGADERAIPADPGNATETAEHSSTKLMASKPRARKAGGSHLMQAATEPVTRVETPAKIAARVVLPVVIAADAAASGDLVNSKQSEQLVTEPSQNSDTAQMPKAEN